MKPVTDATISRLVGLWYEVIGPLHHKDRDCHFGISVNWSYAGDKFHWRIEHNGYLMRPPDETYHSYEEAREALAVFLSDGIINQSDHDDDFSDGNMPESEAKRRIREITQ